MTGPKGTTGKNRSVRWALCALGVLALVGCERESMLPGERFDTRIPLAETLPGPDGRAAASDSGALGDDARTITLPAASPIAAWTSRGYNSQNRLPHAALAASPVEIWSTDIGQGNTRRNRIATDPVAADGLVYTIDAAAQLQATDLTTGVAAWGVSLIPDFDRGGDASGGGLALADGRIFATTPYGELLALDAATGAVLWRQRLGTVLGAPSVAGGLVYVVGRNSEAWAISAADGRLRWRIAGPDVPAVLAGGPAPAVADGRVILPFPSGEMVSALAQSGVTIWNSFVVGGRLGTAYATLNDITADPVVIGGTVYAGNQSGRVVALDARSGTVRWQARDGAYSPLLVAGDSVFFISDRNALIRLDAGDGTQIWARELPLYEARRERRRKAVFTHFGPILAGGQLVVASGDGVIRLFAPESGAPMGSLAVRGGAASHPIVVGDTLLVVSTEGRLHAYR